jgi:hypothetical protein
MRRGIKNKLSMAYEKTILAVVAVILVVASAVLIWK